MRKLAVLLTPLLILAFTLGVMACDSEEVATTPTPTLTPTSTMTPTPESAGEVVISARFAAFQPSIITVAKGETISLKVTSTDSAHTFTIDELGINITVGGGQTATSEIKVDQAGTFTFYCSVPGHRISGMEGTLQVTD
ncbi:MAG: cupredoxin domain-containing protein [Dehalococcoidia bacterium]